MMSLPSPPTSLGSDPAIDRIVVGLAEQPIRAVIAVENVVAARAEQIVGVRCAVERLRDSAGKNEIARGKQSLCHAGRRQCRCHAIGSRRHLGAAGNVGGNRLPGLEATNIQRAEIDLVLRPRRSRRPDRGSRRLEIPWCGC